MSLLMVLEILIIDSKVVILFKRRTLLQSRPSDIYFQAIVAHFPKMERNKTCSFLLLLTLGAAIGVSGLTLQGRGKEVEPHSLPWHAMVRNPSGLNICGGTILSSRFIMSAARCLLPTNPNPNLPTANTIEVGIHSESQGEPSQSSHRIKNVDFHPGFEIIKWSLSNSVNYML